MTTIAARVPFSARRPDITRLARQHAPFIVSVLNAVGFLLVRPDVNDLWAARARASAVQNGVGLTYWFAWFGGGSTPGNYSVLTPYISAFTTAELLGAVSAVAIPLVAAPLVRGTEHPRAATWLVVVAVAANLWSGRVPFLFGSVFTIAALLTLRHRKLWLTIAFALLSILASPVTGAFLAMGLSGVFLSYPQYRRHALITILVSGIGLGGVGLAFGTPGPEPFSDALKVEVVCGLLLLLLTRPPVWLRSTIWLSVIATFVLATFPNGMGSNFSRLVWYGLPAAAVALSKFRVWLPTLMVAPLVIAGVNGTVVDLLNAGKPISTVGYYKPLAAQLDTIDGLSNYRVEVVNHGAHAAYDALLDHATLARGWETQEDVALNSALSQQALDAVTYKVWLDNNAVGYVAVPAVSVSSYPEYTLVQEHTPKYLTLIWQTEDWKLYRVTDPRPIVPSPAHLLEISQSHLTVSVPCKCTVNLRVRWSKFLQATEQTTGDAAAVVNDGSGWTNFTTSQPGTYVLRGSLLR